MREPFVTVNSSIVRKLIQAFNKATEAYPCWDGY
eukprot:gene5856-6148_t